jgi:branched-chain amino acid transport system permease protein
MAGITGPAAFLISILTTGAIYATLSLGLNLQWGYTGLFNFSVAAFWGIGAYTTALLLQPDGIAAAVLGPGLTGGPVAIPLAIVLSGLISGIAAAIIAVPVLRLRGDYLAIATLGFAETIRLILLNETWLSGGGSGMLVNSPLAGVDYDGLLRLALSTGVLVVVYSVLRRGIDSPWGRVLTGIREDEDATKALGKDTVSFKLQSFVIGSAIMGIAGTLIALQISFLVPGQFNPEWTFFIWIGMLLGGTGSNYGALVGGFMLVALLNIPRYVPEFGGVLADARLLVMGVLIIVMMTYKPTGLFGDVNLTEGG